MKINGNHKYKVNENFEVEVWAADAPEGDAPWLRQPGIPNGALFASIDEAEYWVENFLTELQKPKPIIEESEPTV